MTRHVEETLRLSLIAWMRVLLGLLTFRQTAFKDLILLVAVAAWTTGCVRLPKIGTAQELAHALKQKGVQFQKIEPLDTSKLKSARPEEAIALKGDELWIEIFRIEDKRTFKLFAATGMMLAGVEANAKKPIPGKPDAFIRRPFVILVRQEPEKGAVKHALMKIFPIQEK